VNIFHIAVKLQPVNETTFPIYREINGGASFYVIHSNERLTEYQRLGSRYLKHELHAKILPERLLISDMLENENNRWPRLSEVAYQARVTEIKTNENPN
jgi:hypothetical protein